jgi:hypothetical protein
MARNLGPPKPSGPEPTRSHGYACRERGGAARSRMWQPPESTASSNKSTPAPHEATTLSPRQPRHRASRQRSTLAGHIGPCRVVHVRGRKGHAFADAQASPGSTIWRQQGGGAQRGGPGWLAAMAPFLTPTGASWDGDEQHIQLEQLNQTQTTPPYHHYVH